MSNKKQAGDEISNEKKCPFRGNITCDQGGTALCPGIDACIAEATQLETCAKCGRKESASEPPDFVLCKKHKGYVCTDCCEKCPSHRHCFGFDDDPDAHSCSANADASGYCQVCGAIVSGTPAYCKEYGCDPPEKRRW